MQKQDRTRFNSAQRYLFEEKMNEAVVLASQLFPAFLAEDSLFYFPEMTRLFVSLDASEAIVPAIRQLAREDKLKALKDKLLQGLFAIPDQVRKMNALLTSLLPASFIGQILYTPRHFTVSLDRGSLRKVINEINILYQDEQESGRFNELFQDWLQKHPELISELKSRMPNLCCSSNKERLSEIISDKQAGFFWNVPGKLCSASLLSVLES